MGNWFLQYLVGFVENSLSSFTSVPILTLSAIDFFCNKELLIRVPQLYDPKWFQPRLTRRSFILNIVTSILESGIILGFCYLYYGIDSYTDVAWNMVGYGKCWIISRQLAHPTSGLWFSQFLFLLQTWKYSLFLLFIIWFSFHSLSSVSSCGLPH